MISLSTSDGHFADNYRQLIQWLITSFYCARWLKRRLKRRRRRRPRRRRPRRRRRRSRQTSCLKNDQSRPGPLLAAFIARLQCFYIKKGTASTALLRNILKVFLYHNEYIKYTKEVKTT